MDVNAGTKKLFELLGHSPSIESDLESYLIELRQIESDLSKNKMEQFS